MFTIRSKKMMMVSCILLLIFFLSGCYLIPSEEKVLDPPLIEPREVTYDTVAVKRGDIEDYMSVLGTFEPIYQVDVYFTRAEGRIALVNVNFGDEVKEGDILLALDTETLEYNIGIQELYVQRAQISYDRIEAEQENTGERSYALESAAVELEIAARQLENMENILQKSILYAPISGQVVYMSNSVSLGTYVSPYEFLLTIADLTNLQLQYSTSYAFILSFEAGMKVEVEYDDNIYEGEVISVTTDPSARDVKVLRVDVQGLPADIKRGRSATIKLVLDRSEDTLVIPKSALRSYTGRVYVQIFEDGIKKERDVVTGVESEIEIEIVEGLEEGDLVILD